MNVFIIAALSADGFIARSTNELADWTSKEDKKLFVELTKRAGVMVMGNTTFKTIGRPLPNRKNVVYSRQPITQDGVEATSLPPAELVAKLKTDGFSEIAICGGSSIYDMFLRAGVVDELYLTVEPVLFGQGVPLLSDSLNTQLALLDIKQINDNAVLLHYKVKK